MGCFFRSSTTSKFKYFHVRWKSSAESKYSKTRAVNFSCGYTNTIVNGISPDKNTLKAGSTSAVDDGHGKAGVLKSRRAIACKTVHDRKRQNK